MRYDYDGGPARETAAAWQLKLAGARAAGAPASTLRELAKQRDAEVARTLVHQAGQLAGRAQRDRVAIEKRYEAPTSSPQRQAELSEWRDRVACMTTDGLTAALLEAAGDPLNHDWDKLAAVGAEARRRGEGAVAERIGEFVSQPKFTHDPEWQAAREAEQHYTDWHRVQSAWHPDTVSEPGGSGFAVSEIVELQGREVDQRVASDRLASVVAQDVWERGFTAIE